MADRSFGLSGLRALNTDSGRRRSPCSKLVSCVRPVSRPGPLPLLINGLINVVAELPFELFEVPFIKTEPWLLEQSLELISWMPFFVSRLVSGVRPPASGGAFIG